MNSKKLTIKGYLDEECTKGMQEIIVQINPETITRAHELTSTKPEKDAESGITTSSTPAIGMQTITFDLHLDATGIIGGCDNVVEAIEDFKKVCYYYQGKSHGLNYLKLEWGSIFTENNSLLKFRLNSLNIKYLFFDKNGTPLRATMTVNFKQFMSAEDTEATKNQNSPDLTHMMVAKAGDTLPLMSDDVYNDPKYYLQLAKINGLVSIHQLNRGQKIIFPPFQQ